MPVATKKILVDAFAKVLLDKPFKKITVSDITDECGISRMTFYYHFKDIYALLEWSIKTRLSEVVKDKYTFYTWEQGLLSLLNFALEHKAAIIKIFPEFEKKYVVDYLHEFACDMSLKLVQERSSGKRLSEKDMHFIADISAYALVGAIVSWITDGMEESPVDLVNKFSSMFKGMIDSGVICLSDKNV